MTNHTSTRDCSLTHSTYQPQSNQLRRKTSLNMLWPPSTAGDISVRFPSQFERRSSHPEVEMRRHGSELNHKSQRLSDPLQQPSGRDQASPIVQVRSAFTNFSSPTSLDGTNSLPLSSIRALSVPITPGIVKSKRDWITKNSPEASLIPLSHTKSPGNGTISAPGQVLHDWTMIPPFHSHSEPPATRDDGAPKNQDHEELVIEQSLVHQPSPQKRKSLTRDRWPPRPKTRNASDSQSASKPTAKVQVSEKVKMLRSNFEKFEGSDGNGTPWAFRVAQEMYETLANQKSPSKTENKDNATGTYMRRSEEGLSCNSQSLYDSMNGPQQTKHTELIRKALQTATDLPVGSDKGIPPPSIQSDSMSNGTQRHHRFSRNLETAVPTAFHSQTETVKEVASAQDTLPPKGHLANIVLPSGQKLPPPKRRQHRRTNYRIGYDGPTLLRLQDVYRQLYEIPEVDDRFVAEPKDCMAAMPQRKGDSPYSSERRKRPDIAGGVAGDVAPKRPGRNMVDSDTDSIVSSFSSSDWNKEDFDERQSKDRAPEPSSLHRVRGLNRPNVWITPIKVGTTTQRRWKVKRVWDVEVVDDKEVEHCVEHENLMDKLRLLFGVPHHLHKMSDKLDGSFDSESLATPWYIKRVFDIDGEIESSDDDESELALSNSVMVEIMERIFDSEVFVFHKALKTTSHKLALPSPQKHSPQELNEVRASDSHGIYKSVNSGVEGQHGDIESSPELACVGVGTGSTRKQQSRQEQATAATSTDTRMSSIKIKRRLRTSSISSERAGDDKAIHTTGRRRTRKCGNIPHRNESVLLQSQINKPLFQKDYRPPLVQVICRRYSTGGMTSKGHGELLPKKETGDSKSLNSSTCLDENGIQKASRMNNKFGAKGRCLSLQVQSSTPKTKREMKMWWHE